MSESTSKIPPNVFISYSQAATVTLARALQRGLQSFAKPWWRLRAVRVIRDETDLGTTPELWPSIARRLDSADWLVLLATRQAVSSKWVKRELRYWLQRGSPGQILQVPLDALDDPIAGTVPAHREKVLIVLADGEIVWDDGAGDFDWSRTTALPRCLARVFPTEPLWVDLRHCSEPTRSHPEIVNAVARLSVPIRGLELAEIIGEDRRRHQQALRAAWSAAGTLALLTLLVAVVAYVAAQLAKVSEWQRQIAVAQRQAAEAQALASRRPASLVRAAEDSRTAWKELQRLAGPPPVPEVVRHAAEWLADRGLTVVRPLVTEFTLDEPVRRGVDEVLRLADDLTPSLVGAVSDSALTNVNWAAFLPGDRKVAYLRSHNHVAFWNADGSKSDPTRLTPLLYRVNGRTNIAFSGDGNISAAEGVGSRPNDPVTKQIVQVRRVTEETLTHTIMLERIFAPEDLKPRPATGTPRGRISETFIAGAVSAQPVLAGLALNHDGTKLVLVSRGGMVRYVELGEPQQAQAHPAWRMDIPDVDDFARLAALSLDAKGEYLAATPSSIVDRSAPVMAWKALAGTPLPGAPYPHVDIVNALAFAPDGKRLATGGASGTVLVWDLATGQSVRSVEFQQPVAALALGPAAAEGFVLVGGAGVARVFDVSTRLEVARVPQPGRVDVVAWSADGRSFLTAGVLSGSAPLRVWELGSAQRVAPARMRGRDGVSTLAQGAGLLAGFESFASARAWSMRTGEEVLQVDSKGLHPQALALIAEPKSLLAVAARNEQGALAYRIPFDAPQRRILPGEGLDFYGQDGRPFASTVSLDAQGRRFLRVIGRPQQEAVELELWELSEPPRRVLNRPFPKGLALAALSPDGARIFWSEANSDILHSIPFPGAVGANWTASVAKATRIDFASNASRLALSSSSANEGQVTILDAATGKTVGAPWSMEGRLGAVALDQRGEYLAAAVHGELPAGRLLIYEVPRGRLVSAHPFLSDQGGGGSVLIDSENTAIYAAFGDQNLGHPRIWRWRLRLAQVEAALDRRLGPILALDSLPPVKTSTD